MPERAPSNNTPDVGEQITLRFTDMAYGGDAVGRLEQSGIAVFAWPGIEGEKALVEITANRKNLLRGLVTEVLDASPFRTDPPCPYFGPCGGCQWQHVSYEGQLSFKHNILSSQLTRLGGISDPTNVLEPPIPSPDQYHYRNTSHFALDPATRTLGYFKRDSHSVVPVDECPISNEGVNRIIPLVNSILQNAPTDPTPGVPGMPARGVMRVWHVTVRHSESTGQTLLVFHTRSEGRAVPRYRSGQRGGHTPSRPDTGPSLEPDATASPDIPLVRREVRRSIQQLSKGSIGEPLALTVVEVMEDGTIKLLGATRAAGAMATEAAADMVSGRLVSVGVSGEDIGQPLGAWVETLGGKHYWVAPEAFFQANTGAADALLSEVLARVPSKLTFVVDAHAGVGTFGLALSGRAKRVLMFETSNAAIASGRWTALASDVKNAEFQQGKAETLLTKLPDSDRPDLIVLDPPRTGCHPGLLKAIEDRAIPLLVYVSCDPSTLARDIKILSPSYRLESARVVDMFPQTFHIETVAVLSRTPDADRPGEEER